MLLSVGADDFNSSIRSIVPVYLHPLIILGWFGLFISTCESLLLWGAGFWTEDLYRGIKSDKEAVVPAYFKLLAMVFLSLLAITAACDPAKIESFNNRLGKKGPVLQKYLLAVLLGFLYFFIWNLLLWGLVG